MSRDRYRIISRADLPFRMQGTFNSFEIAYLMCCEWNQRHDAKDMAFTVKEEPTR